MVCKIGNKGEVGVGSLLLMITVLLVVLVFVGLYINAANKLETQGYKTVDKTKAMIATKIVPSELQSFYEDGALHDFTVNAQLTPGSDNFYLENLVITMTTEDEKTVLSFAGPNASLNHSHTGYYTLGEESYEVPSYLMDDIDMDGSIDEVYIDAGDAILRLSTGGEVTLGDCSAPDTFSSLLTTNDYIVSVSGFCQAGTVTQVTLTPKDIGVGKYSVEYLIESEHNSPDKLIRGEIIKIYFESQNPIQTDRTGSLTFILKTGSESDLTFYVPDVINSGKVYLSHY